MSVGPSEYQVMLQLPSSRTDRHNDGKTQSWPIVGVPVSNVHRHRHLKPIILGDDKASLIAATTEADVRRYHSEMQLL